MELKLNFWLFKFVQIKNLFFYFSRLSILFLLDSLQKKENEKNHSLKFKFFKLFSDYWTNLGNSTIKVDPLPISLFKSIDPLWLRTIYFTSESPSPVPIVPLLDLFTI